MYVDMWCVCPGYLTLTLNVVFISEGAEQVKGEGSFLNLVPPPAC